MSDMGDDFSALREHNRLERENRRNIGISEIVKLRDLGFFVQPMTEYQWRIGCLIDLYPTRSRFHDLATGERGHYDRVDPVGFITRRYPE